MRLPFCNFDWAGNQSTPLPTPTPRPITPFSSITPYSRVPIRQTYRSPRAGLAISGVGGKLCDVSTMLRYGTRDAFISGVSDMTAAPTLMLAQEFTREMSWADWKGVAYTLQEEWDYVNGAASQKDATPGLRDSNNVGKSAEDFMNEANAFIKKRRVDQASAGGLLLAESHAFLKLEETLAVRLYSGPAYQPINLFLRAISGVQDEYRKALAQDPALTFASTVRHLCRAIRKLAAVTTPAEAARPLYRGVRGELPRTFWVRANSLTRVAPADAHLQGQAMFCCARRCPTSSRWSVQSTLRSCQLRGIAQRRSTI